MTEMLCKDCDKVVLWVRPECEDGLGELDLMCVLCGAAITYGGMLDLDDRRTAAA
ncbi:MAG: hypothetical protein ACXVGH_00925 [Mycobacteriales bacterium]